MTWLTAHFVFGLVAWVCMAVGALSILLPLAFLAACAIAWAVGRLRRWPHRQPQHTVASQSVPDDEWAVIVALIEQTGASE